MKRVILFVVCFVVGKMNTCTFKSENLSLHPSESLNNDLFVRVYVYRLTGIAVYSRRLIYAYPFCARGQKMKMCVCVCVCVYSLAVR